MEGPRAARADELAAVVELADTVFGENRPHDMGRWFPHVFCRANLARLRVFVEDGRPVALAAFTVNRIFVPGASFTVACIGSVCTLASHRGAGLGTRLMDDCVDAALSEGAAVLFISGGRGLYRRMGCIDAGRYRSVIVPRAVMKPETSREAREWRLADVPRMAALLRAEPVRFERTEDEWYAHLRTGRVATRPCRVWVVFRPERERDLEAFVCAQGPVSTRQGTGVLVAEMAGDRQSVLFALPRIAGAMGADGVRLDFLGADTAVAGLVGKLGLEPVDPGFDGTVKVIDPPGLAPALRHLVGSGISIEAGADGFVFRLGSESFAVRGLEEVTAFLFGSIERQAAMPDPGPLRSRLEAAFPIPLPDYGLNYL